MDKAIRNYLPENVCEFASTLTRETDSVAKNGEDSTQQSNSPREFCQGKEGFDALKKLEQVVASLKADASPRPVDRGLRSSVGMHGASTELIARDRALLRETAAAMMKPIAPPIRTRSRCCQST